MSQFAFDRTVKHPYASFSSQHEHIGPATFHHPARSAAVIPFRWMMRDEAGKLGEEYGLDVDLNREPTDGWLEHNTWVQNDDNQRELLEGFFGAIEPTRSLCFFYAKQTPLSDDHDRVLVGVGRVLAQRTAYPVYVQIGRRPTLLRLGSRHFALDRRRRQADGFLVPYHAILERAAQDDST